ncbi:hypothetical protein HY844_00890 [Candidatus Berkelbacteria bacterium]|nr:hypothetical protein [Candidatus Berkelbacteria bacterium]
MSLNYGQVLEADLLELMGAQDATDEQKEEIYTKALKTIENKVLARVFDNLTEEEIKQWEALPENDGEVLKNFLEERAIDIKAFFAEEALIYKTEIASLIEAGKQAA